MLVQSRCAVLMVWILVCGIALTSCRLQPDVSEIVESSDPVNLVYYTIGNPDTDLKLVNDALNKLLKNKINVTISYNKIPWDDYESYVMSLVNAGQPFDIAFAVNYATNALRKAWLSLNDYLTTVGKPMYDAIHPTFWEGVKIDGQIYGVPTNKELAVLAQWMFPREIIEKYNIDLSQYDSLESLESLFAMIKKKEPDYLVMELDKQSHNFFVFYGYEYITERSLPLVVKSLSDKPVIENVFETSDGRHVLDILRRYYLEGYINSDASTYHSASLEKGKKVFFKQADGGPYSDTIWSQQRGYDLVTKTIIEEPIVTTEAVRGGIMCVSANTSYPEECVKFLNCLNTDAEVRNMINFGIEGIHYTLDKNDQVIKAENERYAGVQYTQGNWFLLKTLGGSVPEPRDKWLEYQKFNDSARRSNILGFTPDLRDYLTVLQRIEQAYNKYYPSLMTGSVDVDTFLPKFIQELENAGLNEVKAELQRQLNEWLENK